MRGSHPVAPIASLLEQWRAHRLPALSEQLHLIGDRLPVRLPPLPLKKKTDALREWLAAVKSEPPHLLSARLAQLEKARHQFSSTFLWPLFEALSKLPPDPRIATLAAGILVHDGLLQAKYLRRLLDCVEAHGDDTHFRLLEVGLPLQLFADQLAGRAVRLLQKGLRESPKGPSLTLDERRRLAATTWALPDAPPPLESLLAPIWADPRDLARRQVLADQLLERGDARGEFIALQLASASPKRQQQLLGKHRDAWLGALRDVVDLKHEPPFFEHGFVSEVTVRGVKLAQFLLAADAKEWATVRRVRSGLLRFSAAMVGLEDAGPVKLEALRQLTREALPIALRSVTLAAYPAEAVELLLELPAPPRWLALELATWSPTRELRDQLPRLRELAGLERLRLSAQDPDVLPTLLGEMGLGWLPPSLVELQLRDDERFVVLRRDGPGWSLELVALEEPYDPEWKQLLSGLRWLEPTRVTVSARCELDATDELVARARRFDRPVELVALSEVPDALRW